MLDQPITVLSGVGEKRAKRSRSAWNPDNRRFIAILPLSLRRYSRASIERDTRSRKSHDQRNRCFPGCCKSFWLQKSRLQFRMMQDHDVFNVSF